MSKKNLFICMILVAMMAMGLTACGAKKEETTQVRVGYFNNVTHTQALLMKSEKTLEQKLGKEVKWTAFNAGPAEVEALFAGDIDIGYIGPVPAISANVKSNGDVKVLAGVSKGGSVLIQRKDAGIQSVADLAGKTVAVPQFGNTQHLILLKLLDDSNLKPVTAGGNVTVSAVANADVANTMERGDVDAALVPEPWGATLIEQGAQMVLDQNQVYLEGQYDVAVVVVRKEFLEGNKELVDQFLEQHEAATKRIQEQPEEVQKIINGELKAATGKNLSDSIMKEAFGRISFRTDYNTEAMSDFASLSKEQGFIKELPEEGQLYANGEGEK